MARLSAISTSHAPDRPHSSAPPSFHPTASCPSSASSSRPTARMKIPAWKKEMATTTFRQAVVAEFIATFMFLFSTIGCVV